MMITRPKGSFDVHELVISKEEFEKREKNNQSIYSGVIHNRMVKLFTKGQTQPTRIIDPRCLEDDMQTLFARSSASSFEFKANVEGSSAVEGLLRYHPFLYDKETYPSDAFDPRLDPEPEDDHGYAINEQRARGRRPVFECFWNGRLIPYTLIEDFDWCTLPKKNRSLPVECYNRISGVLWTNDSFQVSTNKLTFLDLEMKLRDKNTVFTRVVNGHVKVQRSSAPLYGTIQKFMLSGDYDGGVYSTGGEVEIQQEPVLLYNEKKVVPLSKLDRTASQTTIKYYIEEEMAKLPSHLVVSWPNGMEVKENEKRSAGKTIGDIKVEISNRKGERISKLPGFAAKKLLVELKVIWHCVPLQNQRRFTNPAKYAEELQWFKGFNRPKGLLYNPQLDILEEYKKLIWYFPSNTMIPQFNCSVDIMADLCCKGWVSSNHILWMMQKVNEAQKDCLCLCLPVHTREMIAQRIGRRGLEDIRKIVFIINVGKLSDNSVYLSTYRKRGFHWVMAIVDLAVPAVLYCDSNAWDCPPDILPVLSDFTSLFGVPVLPPDRLQLAHVPTPTPAGFHHKCSPNCIPYPLQSCGDICGILCMVMMVSVATDPDFFSQLIQSQTLIYMHYPSRFSGFLRRTVISWFLSGTPDTTFLRPVPETPADHAYAWQRRDTRCGPSLSTKSKRQRTHPPSTAGAPPRPSTNNPPIFYKSQGNENEVLKDEDILLCLQIKFQKEMLLKYHSKIICAGSTHKTTQYDFQLTSVLVLDDHEEAIPVAWAIFNREDADALNIFLGAVREACGQDLQTETFLSDLASNFFNNAWCDAFSKPDKRLYCSWHTDKSWQRQVNSLVTGKQTQSLVYVYLKIIQPETKEATFRKMLQEFSSFLSEEVPKFPDYFSKHYVYDNKTALGASCYRLGTIANTNMSAEAFHRTLKTVCFNKKQNRRVDNLPFVLLKPPRDKAVEQLVKSEKGKITHRIREIRKSHETAKSVQPKDIINVSKDEWTIKSSSVASITYSLKKVSSHDVCNCKLICDACNACVHMYTCTCSDYLVIHAVHMNTSTSKETPDSNNSCQNEPEDFDCHSDTD